MKTLHWIASYPKSGNTWFRAFMTALENEEAFQINALSADIVAIRQRYDDALGFSTADIEEDELLRLRAECHLYWGQMDDQPKYYKVHDARLTGDDGWELFPSEVTGGAVYLIRHPYDVAVSFTAHLGATPDAAIDRMLSSNYAMVGRTDRCYTQTRQPMGTWGDHVTSWTSNSSAPLLILRYEDMLSQPQRNFQQAAKFLGLPSDEAAVSAALQRVAIERLQAAEQSSGFREKPTGMASFFRAGRSGDGHSLLNPIQKRRLHEEFGAIMNQWNYEL